MFEERRRLLMNDTGDKKLYIFKEGEGFVNGFTYTYSSSKPTVSKNSVSIGSTRGTAVGIPLLAGYIGSRYEAYPELRNYSTIYFECTITEKKSTGSNIGYSTYLAGNIGVTGSYKIISNTSRTIYSLPLNLDLHDDEYTSLGIFNTSDVYSAVTCYNIWVE